MSWPLQEIVHEDRPDIAQHDDDIPAISGWKWGLKAPKDARSTSTEGDNV